MSAFAAALERGRPRFNARFAAARRESRLVDGAAFAVHLREVVAPVAEASPEARIDAVVDALYDVSLDLMARGLLGHPGVVGVWTRLLPRIPGPLAIDPRRLAAALSNAALQLGDALPVFVDGLAAAPCGTPDELLEAGKVLAWLGGQAHWRAGALKALAGLPESLAATLLGGRVGRDALLAGLADPWWRPGSPQGAPTRLALAAIAGGFTGLGGPFARPPTVRAAGDGLYALDGVGCWSIHADAFGVTLQRAEGTPAEAMAPARVDAEGRVSWRGLSERLPLLAGAQSVAASAHTCVVTLPHSHKLFFVAAVAA